MPTRIDIGKIAPVIGTLYPPPYDQPCRARERRSLGDAAGLTHPITGAGIAAAVASGERAGQAAAAWLIGCEKNSLMDFENTIRDQFGACLERAVARRAWIGQHWRTPAADADRIHRRGWVAFPEYFHED